MVFMHFHHNITKAPILYASLFLLSSKGRSTEKWTLMSVASVIYPELLLLLLHWKAEWIISPSKPFIHSLIQKGKRRPRRISIQIAQFVIQCTHFERISLSLLVLLPLLTAAVFDCRPPQKKGARWRSGCILIAADITRFSVSFALLENAFRSRRMKK